jgi:hypothetical protein
MDRPVDFLTNAICNESEKRANRGAISVCVFDKKKRIQLTLQIPHATVHSSEVADA